MRTFKTTPFGDWAPDAPSIGNSQVARNVIPGEGGSYRPFPGFDALDDTAQTVSSAFTSAFVAHAGDGAIDVLATTAADIYRWDGDSWTSANSGFSDGEWRFAQWGDEIVATNPTHGFYYGNIGGTFSNDATPPAARFIARVDYRIWLAHLSGYPNAFRWCGFNDRTKWTIGDRAAGSDIQYMPREYGAITGIRGGTLRNAVIFQERAISIASQDAEFIYAFDTVEEELGCSASRSIQTYGRLTFFVSQEGPAVFDGQRAQLIGDGRWRRWFQDAVRGVTQSPIYSAIDKKNKCVVWYWRPDDEDPVSQGLIYNFAENRAAEWRPGAAYPLVMNLPASIADTNALTSTTIGSYTGNALQTRLSGVADRPRLDENTTIIGAIDPDTDQLGRFSGSALEATIATPEWMMEPNKITQEIPRSKVSGAVLIGDVQPDQFYVTMSRRQDGPGDAQTEADERRGNANGRAPVDSSGTAHLGTIRIPAGQEWEHVQGVHFTLSGEGER